MKPPVNFQEIILRLQTFWASKGCILVQPLDIEVGAGTFHPTTFLKSIGPEPWSVAYAQSCRRPTDGRYGENPNRLQHFYQFQVILKPSPLDIQEQYLESLKFLGIDLLSNDIRFVEDNWESPSLGAWGLGWEVWQNGMEISQFTYFQQVGGLACAPITGELTYGLERLAMFLFNVDTVYDLPWGSMHGNNISYADLFHRQEYEMSKYNFEYANIDILMQQFTQYEEQVQPLIDANLPLPAYELIIKASHVFNLLDARNAISVSERQRYILKLRQLSKMVAEAYYESRKQLNFPLMQE